MEEELIELVRGYPALYDLSHKLYSDNFHKKKVWEEIGRSLNKSGAECKQRWTSLRSQHRKVRQKSSTTSGQAARKWKFEESMSFLLSHMKDKGRVSTVYIEEEADDGLQEESDEEDSIQSAEETLFPTSASAASTSTISLKKTPETASATVMRYLLEHRKEKTAVDKEVKDSTDLFFESMLKTVKTFSPVDQHHVKSQFFKLVSEMEAKYLMPQPPPSSHNIPNP